MDALNILSVRRILKLTKDVALCIARDGCLVLCWKGKDIYFKITEVE